MFREQLQRDITGYVRLSDEVEDAGLVHVRGIAILEMEETMFSAVA
jgi:hypothetical protein